MDDLRHDRCLMNGPSGGDEDGHFLQRKRKGSSLRSLCGTDNAHSRGGSSGQEVGFSSLDPIHSERRRESISHPYASCVHDRAVTKRLLGVRVSTGR